MCELGVLSKFRIRKMSEVLSNLCLTAVLTDAKKAIALIAKHLVLYDRYVLQAFWLR